MSTREPEQWVIPTYTLVMTYILVFMAGIFCGVTGMAIVVLW